MRISVKVDGKQLVTLLSVHCTPSISLTTIFCNDWIARVIIRGWLVYWTNLKVKRPVFRDTGRLGRFFVSRSAEGYRLSQACSGHSGPSTTVAARRSPLAGIA